MRTCMFELYRHTSPVVLAGTTLQQSALLPATKEPHPRDLVIFNTGPFCKVAVDGLSRETLSALNLQSGPSFSPSISISNSPVCQGADLHHFIAFILAFSLFHLHPHCRFNSPSDGLKGSTVTLLSPFLTCSRSQLLADRPCLEIFAIPENTLRACSALAPRHHPSLPPHHRHHHHRGPNPQSTHLQWPTGRAMGDASSVGIHPV